MARDIYEALLDPDKARQLGPEAEALSHLGQLARERRRWQEGSLAEAEYLEGLHADEADVAPSQGVRLAADDRTERAFPARYSDGPWRVALGLDAMGAAFVLLESGPGPATVVIGELRVELRPGERQSVELQGPPATVELEHEGTRRTLR